MNKNSTLTNELAESENKIATILSQNILLQQQLAAPMKSTAKTAAGPSARDEDMEEEDGLPLDMRGGGGNSWPGQEDAEPLAPGMPVKVSCPVQHYLKDTMMDDDGPDMIHGGGGQGLGSESSEDPLEPKAVRNLPWGYGEGPIGHGSSFEDLLPYRRNKAEPNESGGSTIVVHGVGLGRGPLLMHGDDTDFDPPTLQGWTSFLQAAEVHWKWPATDPQHPRSAREPPPGHALNIYTMTNSEAQDYAAMFMQLDEAGIVAFLAHVWHIWLDHSKWERAAEGAIISDRQTRKSPDEERRPCCLLQSDEGIWILTQRKLAKQHPNSTPQDLWLLTQEGYCSMIECGVARDTTSALVLPEQYNKVDIPLLAELKRVQEVSFLKFVALSNHRTTRDELQQSQEVIIISPASVHFQHYIPINDFGDCYNRVEYEPTSVALQDWGPRVQSMGIGQGSGTSPAAFVRAHQNLTELGHRPISGSSSTTLQGSTSSPQSEESASKSGREVLE